MVLSLGSLLMGPFNIAEPVDTVKLRDQVLVTGAELCTDCRKLSENEIVGHLTFDF